MAEAVYLKRIIQEMDMLAGQVDGQQLETLASVIRSARRIFVGGAGRSGFSAKAFANRLMHLGFTVYVVGETTTPAIGAGDLLLICSGSGETSGLKTVAEKAKRYGANCAAMTIHRDSSIGSLADHLVILPGTSKKEQGDSIQPMGTSFEQLSWLTFDSVVLILMDRLHRTSEEMFSRHANLE